MSDEHKIDGQETTPAPVPRKGHALTIYFSKVLIVIVGVSLLTLGLEHAGWLSDIETAGLDTWFRSRVTGTVVPPSAYDVVIVAITEEDYRKVFRQRSPLNPGPIAEVVQAIALGEPRVIGVDLDTSDSSFETLQSSPEWPAVVWAQDALIHYGGESAGAPPDAKDHPAEKDHETRMEPLAVLGQAEPVSCSGLALLPHDRDGIVRSYQREFRVTGREFSSSGRMDSFPWALVKAYCHAAKDAGSACRSLSEDESLEKLVLNFSGDRYTFPRFSLQSVLHDREGRIRSQFKDKIVLLGGFYRAARDEHNTPLGPMAGVELAAQAVESELKGGGIRRINKLFMLLLEIVGGLGFVMLHHRLNLGLALLLSILLIPLLSMLFSLIAFHSLAYCLYFVPILTIVVIHQLYEHAKEYRNMLVPHRSAHSSQTGDSKVKKPGGEEEVGSPGPQNS